VLPTSTDRTQFKEILRVIHRGDYPEVLLEEARSLGAQVRLNASVKTVDFHLMFVVLAGGERIYSGVIIGADSISHPSSSTVCSPAKDLFCQIGLWSMTRSLLLGYQSPPLETGDLPYRGTFELTQLRALNTPLWTKFATIMK
jgi:salicylate hydroxylase